MISPDLDVILQVENVHTNVRSVQAVRSNKALGLRVEENSVAAFVGSNSVTQRQQPRLPVSATAFWWGRSSVFRDGDARLGADIQRHGP